MNTQVSTFPDRVKIKADLAAFSACPLSSDSNQGVLTKAKRSKVWREIKLNEAWPSCVIVSANAPKRLNLVNEISNEIVKKVDLPGNVVHVAMHDGFYSNGQILAIYEDQDNPLKIHVCILKYDGTKTSIRRYPNMCFDTPYASQVRYRHPDTAEEMESSRLDTQDIFALSTVMLGDMPMTPQEFFTSEVKKLVRANTKFSFRSWNGADESSITAEHVVARNMSSMRMIQFFKYSYQGYRNKFLQFSDLSLVSRYRRGTCLLSSSDSARLNHKFVHSSLRTLLEIDDNQNWVSLLMRGCSSENLMTKESFGFFPYRTPSIRYSEYNLEKSMMLFKLPDDTTSLSCSKNKVYVAVNNEVHVFDDFQRAYTEAVSANKGVISEDARKATVKSLLPTDPSNVSYFNKSWEDLLKKEYIGSLDNASELKLGDPSSVYTFNEETVVKVKAHGSDPFEMLCVHTMRFGEEASENRKHKSDTLYVYLAGRLVFKKAFSNSIASFKPYVVSVNEEGTRDNCFPGTSVKEVCIDVCLDGKIFISFDVFPERSTVSVRDIQREQVQTRTVSAPQLSRFIDF